MPELDGALASMLDFFQSWAGSRFEAGCPASEEYISAAERELGVVYPRSYRSFLRYFGTGTLHYFEIYGIPMNHLWGDVVMMNQLSSQPVPARFVKFTEKAGERGYYFDTSQMNSERECPVVAIGSGREAYPIADSFLDFLRKVGEGLV